VVAQPGHALTEAGAGGAPLAQLTKTMCCEWARYNVQVNGIGPGENQVE